MSHLALGRVWLAMLDVEAGVDCSPELGVAHLRLGEVYAAAGGSEPALRAFQRAAALAPTSQSIASRLERARNSPATPLTGSAGAFNGGSAFEMSLDQVDNDWDATVGSVLQRVEPPGLEALGFSSRN